MFEGARVTGQGGLVLKGFLRQCKCHFTAHKHQTQEELAEMSFHWVHQTTNSAPSRSYIWLFGLFWSPFSWTLAWVKSLKSEMYLYHAQTLSPEPCLWKNWTYLEDFWSAGWVCKVGVLGGICHHHLSRGGKLTISSGHRCWIDWCHYEGTVHSTSKPNSLAWEGMDCSVIRCMDAGPACVGLNPGSATLPIARPWAKHITFLCLNL